MSADHEPLIVSILNCYDLKPEVVHDRVATREACAAVRMHVREAVKPYAELAEAANAFLSAGNFYLPGSEDAVRLLDRFRRAAQAYQMQRHRERREEEWEGKS